MNIEGDEATSFAVKPAIVCNPFQAVRPLTTICVPSSKSDNVAINLGEHFRNNPS